LQQCETVSMNQFAPKSSFDHAVAFNLEGFNAQKLTFQRQLRCLAAQFGMHYAVIHRLGPPQMKLTDATYRSIIRNFNETNYTLGDLLDQATMERLLAGNCAVEWQKAAKRDGEKHDPFDRLNIRFGVSVPFHNAFGNHAALTLFDSSICEIDLFKLTILALPLINEILCFERAKNACATVLSTRETDCLQWAAAGKTSLETGIILGLSPHTVNQYLTAATAKLKAVNRTHAVTKAVRLGLINLSAV
jgi:DNA-binding CsgD family transcriptional regulator